MPRPNVLIFMTDQQQCQVVRPDHPCRTPHVERLAAQGLRFERAYTIAPHCCPSRASFMTGLMPNRHGVFNNVTTGTAINTGLRAGVVTFSEVLRASGYRLSLSGKWHVSRDEAPADRGWEERHVTSPPQKQRPYERSRWENPNTVPDRGEPRANGEIVRPGYTRLKLYGSFADRGPKGYEGTGDHRIVQNGIAALQELASGDEPWFVYIGPNGPHDPFIIPERYAKMYDPEQIPLPASYVDDLADKPRIYQRMRRDRWGQLTEREVRESIAHYWGYCTMMDDLFGEVLQALDETGAAENTLVIYMSDHGEYCGAHGLYMKGIPAFEEAYHVPTVVRWPAGIAQPG
ncbi:MAG TPA: sulfatase-like hydrolase/transferase, partial [Limnochordia bacterium]|nr:sulfatase-like hydrolase/transferase [Limnochordia bacterium]